MDPTGDRRGSTVALLTREGAGGRGASGPYVIAHPQRQVHPPFPSRGAGTVLSTFQPGLASLSECGAPLGPLAAFPDTVRESPITTAWRARDRAHCPVQWIIAALTWHTRPVMMRETDP
jgi:hypothetical protein